jgi:DNA-binding XRE family transcriptional regulator
MTRILESEPASFNRLGVRAWRRARWLTQYDLGQLLGVKAQTVYRWECGQSEVPTFLKLALDQLDTLHYWSPDGIDALPRLDPVS